MASPRGDTDAFLAKIVPALPSPPALSTTTWTPVGPGSALQATGGAAQPASGRIVDIAPHPSDPNILYLAAAGGGVWKSTNGGAHWLPLTDSQVTPMMGAAALAPSAPNVIYAGTGESTGV